MSLEQALKNFESRKNEHLEDLKKLVRVPSISFPGFEMADVERSAEAVAALFRKIGLDRVQVLKGKNNPRPYVYGEHLKAPGAPTLLLYAHHDVQPVGQVDKWKSAPFEPVEREGRLYGRGAADDKAGVVIHTAAISSWLQAVGRLPVNVKLLIEGEEEIGSPGLPDFLEEHHDLVQADILVLTDTDNYSTTRPGLTVALRGLVSVGIEVKSLRQSVHSGMWGGPVPDPVQGLAKILAQLSDDQGSLAIPGMWDSVKELTPAQKKTLASLEESEAEFRAQSGLLPGIPITGGAGSIKEKVWFKPSITVNAIEASSRKNAANIICESAWAKVSIRLVPDMDPQDILKKLTAFIKSKCPWGLQVEVQEDGAGRWWTTNTDHPAFEAAVRAMRDAWGSEPVLMGCGGSIPFVQPFSDALGGAPALLIGVEDPLTYAHSENESLHLGVWEKSVKSCIRFFEYASRLPVKK